MPEGDTIYGAARRIRAALVGKEIASIETPHPRFDRDRWPERLHGRAVRAVDTKGKHLFIRFDGDLTLHSHLRMNGWWGVYERGRRWGKAPSRAWLVIRTDEHEVVQFGGPVLELMTDSRSRFDQRIARLGPDILAEEFDDAAFLRRLQPLRHREPVASRGVLSRRARPVEAAWRGDGRAGARRGARGAPAHAALGPGRRARA